MLMQHTLTQLKALKLDGMARAFESSQLTASTSLSFEERVHARRSRAGLA